MVQLHIHYLHVCNPGFNSSINYIDDWKTIKFTESTSPASPAEDEDLEIIGEYSNPGVNEQTRDELIFDLIKRRYDDEKSRAKDQDGKAETLAGFTSIVLSLLVGAGALQLLKLILNNWIIRIPYFVGTAFLYR